MAKPPGASLVHHYEDPRDALMTPHRFMALTHYYVDRWLPELGERGHIIVTVLRRMGYLDRERDVERGGIEIEQEELAALCGLKLRTLQREFGDEGGQPVNPVLHLFVQREKQYYRNGAGRIVREKTVYVVQMKDPVHPSDLAALQKEAEHREKGRSRQSGGNGEPRSRQSGGNGEPRSRQSGGNGEPRSRQSGGNGEPRSRQSGGDTRQSDASSRQSGGDTRQVGGNYKVDITLNTLESHDTPAADGVSLTLFQEPEAVRGWAQLTEAEQQPYRIQAEQELTMLFGFAEWSKIGARAHDRQVCTRAETLYKAAVKEDRG